MEGKEYYQSLLEKFMAGTASEEERADLFEELQQDTDTEGWVTLIREISEAADKDEAYDRRRWKPVFEQVLQKAGARQRDTRRWLFVPPGRIMAAAVLLFLLIVSGIYIRYHRSQVETAQSARPVINDLPPGGNRAVLTLAGGQHIDLDSAADGQLAQRGSTRVLKLSNGQLAYSATDAKNGKILYDTLTTPMGGQYMLTLPDGTKVWLNAASSIIFPASFNDKERAVSVTGEVYMEVAKNSKQPFKVKVNEMEIAVLGTSFDINAYGDEPMIRTTLVEGRIRLGQDGKSKEIMPGQQGQVIKGEIKLAPKVEMEQVLAWKNGLFNFNNVDLYTIMRQLSRWYNIKVEYSGTLPDRNFAGELPRDLSLAQVLKILDKIDVHYKITEDHKLIISQ
ncbi:MAG TPA: FecR family protein [Puia sp.]|nr:FecR family protein [Puia sp.]